jgi:hypothetical protein
VNTDNSITAQTISAQWNPEPRDMRALIRAAGVPRSFMLILVALWVVGMLLLASGWRYEPIGRFLASLLVLAPSVLAGLAPCDRPDRGPPLDLEVTARRQAAHDLPDHD